MEGQYEVRGRKFEFNDHICVEMVMASDEKRTGRLVQIRKGIGAFGTDLYIVRLRDGSLMTFENVMIRHVHDSAFEQAFYVSNGIQPPDIPDQPPHEDDDESEVYSIQGDYPEAGFIVENPKQPKSSRQCFGIIITSKEA